MIVFLVTASYMIFCELSKWLGVHNRICENGNAEMIL